MVDGSNLWLDSKPKSKVWKTFLNLGSSSLGMQVEYFGKVNNYAKLYN